MCDTYVEGVGYLCGDCQAEFKDYLAFKQSSPETEGAIKRELEAFLETRAGTYNGGKIDIDSFFKQYTK